MAHRALLIGNASHTLHPIAGQGFNLGVRDAIALRDSLACSDDASSYRSVSGYWQLRAADYRTIIGLTDGLVRGFSNQLWPLTTVRSIALFGLDQLGPVRNQFARQTMGFKA